MTDQNPWSGLYNTPLSSDEQALYQQWIQNLAQQRGWDVNHASDDYDMQGYWKKNNGAQTQYANGHFTDEFKKPNHMTFSDQSQYSGDRYKGGTWSPAANGQWQFTPSATNYAMHSYGDLKRYWNMAEPNNTLNDAVLNQPTSQLQENFTSLLKKSRGGEV